MTTIDLKYIDFTSTMPDMTTGQRHVEILGRRTLHGPEVLVKVPFDEFCDKVLSKVCNQAAADLRQAQDRMARLNGCFVVPGKKIDLVA